jgi:hypothetical protein
MWALTARKAASRASALRRIEELDSKAQERAENAPRVPFWRSVQLKPMTWCASLAAQRLFEVRRQGRPVAHGLMIATDMAKSATDAKVKTWRRHWGGRPLREPQTAIEDYAKRTAERRAAPEMQQHRQER